MSNTERVIVLGAGLHCVCSALALEEAGKRVLLVDQASGCLQRASLRNEGKIHLGFVYANDPTFRTSALMLEAALAFSRLLDTWMGAPIDWSGLRSREFTYLVMRDSLVPAESVLASWRRLDETFQKEAGRDGAPYLGRTLDRLLKSEVSHADHQRFVAPGVVAAAVDTEETAIDPVGLRDLLEARIARSARIATRYCHRVEAIARTPAGFRLEGRRTDGSRWQQDADTVVNCLWDGRLRLDEQLGVVPTRPWVYRLKYRLLGTLPRALWNMPSLTLVLGPCGDLVVRPEGQVYVSWYPVCLKGWSSEVSAPSSWASACEGRTDPQQARALARDALAAFDCIVPGLLGGKIETVDAGVIFSWGRTDIDDPISELHRRDSIGITAVDGYYSINTGKLTCAPLFARQLVDLMG